MNKPNKTIIIARAIIRIGDAARNANDYSLLGALPELVTTDGKPSVDELTTKINQQLARRGQAQVEASDQSVLKFEPLVHLVTAAYAKNEGGVTAGLSIALVVNQDGSVDLPRNHFLNAELLDYFDENRPVNWRSVERDLPSKLHGYHLVAGSVEVQEILPRELEAMSF